METITQKQFEEDLKLDPDRGHRMNLQSAQVLTHLKELEIGTALILKNEEWLLKTPADIYISSYFRKNRSDKEFVIRRLLDKSGFAILRIN